MESKELLNCNAQSFYTGVCGQHADIHRRHIPPVLIERNLNQNRVEHTTIEISMPALNAAHFHFLPMRYFYVPASPLHLLT
jgi:hypothetical protein